MMNFMDKINLNISFCIFFVLIIFNAKATFNSSETWDSSLSDIELEKGNIFSHLKREHLVKHLLKRPNFNYNLALLYLAMLGRPEVIEYLIDDLKANVNLEIDGQTPINRCSSRIVNLKILLDRGADINHLDRNGQNVGFGAVNNGNDDILSLLIEKGLDLNVIDNNSNTMISQILVFHRSTLNNQAKIIKLLNENMKNPDWNERYYRDRYNEGPKNYTILEETLLYDYCVQMMVSDKILILKALFEAGADFNVINQYNGWTLLHFAESNYYNGFKNQITEFLLTCGVNPKILDKKGLTAKELGQQIEIKNRKRSKKAKKLKNSNSKKN